LKKKIVAVLFMTLTLLAILGTLSGCFGSTAVAAGWAGVTVSGDNLYTVSGLGQLSALTAANGNILWGVVLDTTSGSGGGLGCSAASTAVPVYGNMSISGDQLYIAGYNGKVYTFNANTRLSSSITLEEDDFRPIVGGTVVDNGKVYVGSSNGNLYALDAASLTRVWRFETGNKIWSTPAVDNGVIFVGSFDKKVYAVDANTGVQKWSFTTEGAILATPVIDNGTVYVASFDRKIYALDEATGSLKWQFPAAGQNGDSPLKWFWATPVISNGILYAPCLDGKVYAVKTQDGALVTTFDLGTEISSSPVVVDGKVVVATQDAKIYSLDASGTKSQILVVDLRIKDSNQSKLTVSASLSASGGIVFIHGFNSEKIYALDMTTGVPKAYPLESVSATTPATTTITATATVTVTSAK
jgi:outer membrane protein assembly factor BamB